MTGKGAEIFLNGDADFVIAVKSGSVGLVSVKLTVDDGVVNKDLFANVENAHCNTWKPRDFRNDLFLLVNRFKVGLELDLGHCLRVVLYV